MSSAPTRLRAGAIAGFVGAVTVASVLAASVPSDAAVKAVAATTAADWTFPSNAETVAAAAKSIRADVAYSQGITGKGVGVALIDTGVAPVQGLTSGNVVNGPDLSLESQVPSLLHTDGFGHGTHMAGIIAGRDSTDGTGFRGIAPDVKLTSVKVGMSNGAVDVSQMLAAIDWVVKHRNDDPANPIKVINLSYGTDSTLLFSLNPLAYAVENAVRAGINVVVAAGNNGHAITVPATDPQPVVVSSRDSLGTTNPADDPLSDFSSKDGRVISVDTTAPGRSIVSLRDPGSYADTFYPSARVGDRFFKGTGTSQAAAVVTGAIALFLQKYPTATPGQVRMAVWKGMVTVGVANQPEVDVSAMLSWGAGGSVAMPYGTGTGSLDAARGTSKVTFGNSTTLTGENDIFGPFSTSKWAAASTNGTSWNGGSWMGHAWTGTTWGTASNNQANWAGTTWSGRAWSGRAWSDVAWSGRAWSSGGWTGAGFSGAAWTGVSWSGATWG
ncbi:MAG: serine protease AprX [Cryptosporangiaceae bacterium]|nr:serine protease AprX [Cryptosporangiaceae bacterium]MDQ1657698.1 serine protease AprX [Cryptosporangiaceae bacterium]